MKLFLKLLNQQKKLIQDFETEKELKEYIFAQTEYGIYRTWSVDNRTYYDCGKNTYFTEGRRNRLDNRP